MRCDFKQRIVDCVPWKVFSSHKGPDTTTTAVPHYHNMFNLQFTTIATQKLSPVQSSNKQLLLVTGNLQFWHSQILLLKLPHNFQQKDIIAHLENGDSKLYSCTCTMMFTLYAKTEMVNAWQEYTEPKQETEVAKSHSDLKHGPMFHLGIQDFMV